MQTSEKIGEIAKAFAAAQLELENVTKDKTNPAFKSQYATLAAVLDVVRPVMAKHGIAIVQAPGNNAEGYVTVTTTLAHASGEWMSSCVVVPTPKNDAQGVGSAISYGRRYSLAAMCGVAQEDDDGNAASAHATAPSRPANVRTAPTVAPTAQSPVVAQSAKPTLDQQTAKKEQARQEIRANIQWMGAAHEERELLANLDNLDDDDLRKEYKRIKEARKAIETTDLPL